MTDSLETSEAEAMSPDHFPEPREMVEPPALITVPAAALRELGSNAAAAGKERGNG